MQILKSVVKANLAKDPLDIIFWADPTTNTYKEAMISYKSSSMKERAAIEERAYRKLQKHKEPKIQLAILCFFDYLIADGHYVDLERVKPSVNTKDIKSQKEKVAEESFFNFYVDFLRMESKKPYPSSQFKDNDFKSNLKYCEIAIESVFKTIQADFLIDYVLSHSESKSLKSVTVNRILRRTANDLSCLNHFLNANIQKIINQETDCFKINLIYEKVIYFGKQSSKLQTLRRKAKCDVNVHFEFYKINTELNKKIEMEMLNRESERKQYFSEKNIGCRNQKIIIPSFPSSPHFECEDSILLMNDNYIC